MKNAPRTPPRERLLADAVENFSAALSQDRAPDLEEFCAGHPEIQVPLRRALSLHLKLRLLAQAEPQPVPPCRRLGPYRMGEHLGNGGMASVFRAWDERLKRDVAVKVIRMDPGMDSDRRQRFLREARVMAGIVHPNILAIYDLGDRPGLSWLSMELMAGSLADHLGAADREGTEGGSRLEQIVRWICTAAEAVAHCHSLGILHRDLKPENLLLNAEGVLKVADFGIAQVRGWERLTRTGHAVGTAAYAAPEQLRGEAVDARADVFGLGACLVALVAGRTPPLERNGSDLCDLLPAATPASLLRILRRATAFEPARRYGSAQELCDALRGWNAAGRSGWRLPRFPRRAASLLTPVALALLLALALATLPNASDNPRSLTGRTLAEEERSAYLLYQGAREGLPPDSLLTVRLSRWYETNLGLPESLRPGMPAAVPIVVGGQRFLAGLGWEAGRLSLDLTLDGELQASFPLDRAAFPEPQRWRLVAGAPDLDGDQVAEMLLEKEDELAVVKWRRSVFRNPAAGWTTQVGPGFRYGSPAVADWDANGRPDLLVGDFGSSSSVGEGSSTLWVLQADSGAVVDSLPLIGQVLSTPQILPASGGGIVSGSGGGVVSGVASHVASHVASGIASDVVSGVASGGISAYLDTMASRDPYRLGNARLWRLRPGVEERAAALRMPFGSLTWPVLQDVDGDGETEVLIGGWSDFTAGIQCLRADLSGEPLWVYPAMPRGQVTEGTPLSYLLLSDQDGRGEKDLCFAVPGAFSCIRTDSDLRPEERLLWTAELALDEYVTQAAVALPDMDGDGFEELAIATTGGRVYLLSRAAPGHILGMSPLPATLFEAGQGTRPRVHARLAVLDSGSSEPSCLVAATHDGWVHCVALPPRDRPPLWSFPADGSITATPQIVRLTSGGEETSAVLIASHNAWLYLLEPPTPEGDPLSILWSFQGSAAIGGTPLVLERQGRPWAYFTDFTGWVHGIPIAAGGPRPE